MCQTHFNLFSQLSRQMSIILKYSTYNITRGGLKVRGMEGLAGAGMLT